jgi:hypothetical protein
MSRRNVLKPHVLASAQSLASSFQTDPTNIENLDNIAYAIQTNGVTDNAGTFGVQLRLKKADSPSEVTPWIDLTLDAPPTLNNADNNFYIYLSGLVATEIRLVFTAAGTAPDGTAALWISGVQAGG